MTYLSIVGAAAGIPILAWQFTAKTEESFIDWFKRVTKMSVTTEPPGTPPPTTPPPTTTPLDLWASNRFGNVSTMTIGGKRIEYENTALKLIPNVSYAVIVIMTNPRYDKWLFTVDIPDPSYKAELTGIVGCLESLGRYRFPCSTQGEIKLLPSFDGERATIGHLRIVAK